MTRFVPFAGLAATSFAVIARKSRAEAFAPWVPVSGGPIHVDDAMDAERDGSHVVCQYHGENTSYLLAKPARRRA